MLCQQHHKFQKSYYFILTRMRTVNLSLLVVIAILSISMVNSKPIYDHHTSYVIQLTPFNFNDQILKIRQNTNQVSIVHFYTSQDGKSADFVSAMNEWTAEFRGVFKIGAVDCNQHYALCKKENVNAQNCPVFKIYPPNPIPVHNYEGQLDTEKLQKAAAKYLKANVIEITNTNIQTFINQSPSVPKVFLFTEKPKGVPMIYKGLSIAFEKKLNFGIVRSSDSQLISKYSIKSFPSIILIKTGDKAPHRFTGKQFKFNEIFEFLNVFSEVFVPGGGSSLDSSATKQWMTESFPELHAKSAKDICLDLEGTLCVIFVTKQKPSKQMSEVFDHLKKRFEIKVDRGAKFKFMWLNAALQKAWGNQFQYDGNDKVIVLNPGKRKRYTVHEGMITQQLIGTTLDTIVGGDARFNRISQLPAFEIRTE